MPYSYIRFVDMLEEYYAIYLYIIIDLRVAYEHHRLNLQTSNMRHSLLTSASTSFRSPLWVHMHHTAALQSLSNHQDWCRHPTFNRIMIRALHSHTCWGAQQPLPRPLYQKVWPLFVQGVSCQGRCNAVGIGQVHKEIETAVYTLLVLLITSVWEGKYSHF